MFYAHSFVAYQTAGVVRKDPLSHRQVLVILENLYDLVLEVEQLRRDQPPQEEEEAYQTWLVCIALLLYFLIQRYAGRNRTMTLCNSYGLV